MMLMVGVDDVDDNDGDDDDDNDGDNDDDDGGGGDYDGDDAGPAASACLKKHISLVGHMHTAGRERAHTAKPVGAATAHSGETGRAGEPREGAGGEGGAGTRAVPLHRWVPPLFLFVPSWTALLLAPTHTDPLFSFSDVRPPCPTIQDGGFRQSLTHSRSVGRS